MLPSDKWPHLQRSLEPTEQNSSTLTTKTSLHVIHDTKVARETKLDRRTKEAKIMVRPQATRDHSIPVSHYVHGRKHPRTLNISVGLISSVLYTRCVDTIRDYRAMCMSIRCRCRLVRPRRLEDEIRGTCSSGRSFCTVAHACPLTHPYPLCTTAPRTLLPHCPECVCIVGVTPVCQAAMSGQSKILMAMVNSNQACRKSRCVQQRFA